MNKHYIFENATIALCTGSLTAYFVSSMLPNVPTIAGALFVGALFLASLVFTCGSNTWA